MNTKAAETPLQSGGAAAGAPVNGKADASQRAKSRSLKPLRRLMPFLFRYRSQMLVAGVFLILAAASTLIVPVAVRRVIDNGFSGENAAFVDQLKPEIVGASDHTSVSLQCSIVADGSGHRRVRGLISDGDEGAGIENGDYDNYGNTIFVLHLTLLSHAESALGIRGRHAPVYVRLNSSHFEAVGAL